ncbi:MAG: NADH-quinone oxidoreductase subunit J [Siphonobacter sp.]
MAFLFIFFILLTLGSAVVVLVSRNVLYSAFSLMVTFLGLAGLYVFSGADFLAVAQIMVYVGGILVLMVFGVMLTTTVRATNEPNTIRTEHLRTLWAVIVAGIFFVIISTVLTKAHFQRLEASHFDILARKTTVNQLGVGLMTEYVLPFEIAGVLLMIALLGAAYLSATKPTKQSL